MEIYKNAMPGGFLTNLFPAGVFIAIILTVVFSEWLKKLDKKDVFKGYRVILPLFLSLGFSWLLRIGNFFQSPDQVWFYWAVIFMIAIVFYELIIKKVEEKWGIFLKK